VIEGNKGFPFNELEEVNKPADFGLEGVKRAA